MFCVTPDIKVLIEDKWVRVSDLELDELALCFGESAFVLNEDIDENETGNQQS